MYDSKSILQMARGAFQERVDLEMAKVIENILDPNTKPTQKRKLTMTIEFVPDDGECLRRRNDQKTGGSL